MLVDAWLTRAAALRPDAIAVEAPEGALSYAELRERAAVLPARLGERVAIALEPGLDFAVALHAVLLAGATAVPIDPRLSDDERAARTAGCSVVVDAPLSGPVIEVPGTHDLDTVALGMHTSGTTAAPRPVDLTYGNVLWSALGSVTALGFDPEERWLCAMPLAHVGGLSILLRSAIYGDDGGRASALRRRRGHAGAHGGPHHPGLPRADDADAAARRRAARARRTSAAR